MPFSVTDGKLKIFDGVDGQENAVLSGTSQAYKDEPHGSWITHVESEKAALIEVEREI